MIRTTLLGADPQPGNIRSMGTQVVLCIMAALSCSFASLAEAAETVVAFEVVGEVAVRPPKSKDFSAVRSGDRIGHGARLRTGPKSQVVLQFKDGTKAKMAEKSEVVVRAPGASGARPNGLVLFFGRVWSSVVKSVSGKETFEVRGANAVAGVRGTKFEVGVADDGSARVVVSEGLVDVTGDVQKKPVPVSRGYEVESDNRGRLQGRRKAPKTVDWDGWFARRARALEARGKAVAEDLKGRLDRRRSQLDRLVNQQKALREQIESLEERKRLGEPVERELKDKLRALERVTARLEDMKRRLQAAFGIFDLWGRRAAAGSMANAGQISLLAKDVKKVEKGFLDLFEEGTDLSEDSLEEAMDDMKKGPTLRPRKRLKDELF